MVNKEFWRKEYQLIKYGDRIVLNYFTISIYFPWLFLVCNLQNWNDRWRWSWPLILAFGVSSPWCRLCNGTGLCSWHGDRHSFCSFAVSSNHTCVFRCFCVQQIAHSGCACLRSLASFRQVWNSDNSPIFYHICFCVRVCEFLDKRLVWIHR